MPEQNPSALANLQRFEKLTFDDFRALAQDDNLSCYEKIGFPDAYRRGYEENIFRDISAKLPVLHERGKIILDIGPGCSEVPRYLIELCKAHEHMLILCDSAEMLALLPDQPFIVKVPGRFPHDAGHILSDFGQRVDALLCYSVLHYVFVEQPLFPFVDAALGLLADGGCFLLGDIPNISKRKRFFSSAAGIRFHQRFTATSEIPQVAFNCAEAGKIDDATVLALVARCRAAGFDAYVVPQPPNLPMANRREDILISRP